MGAFQRAKLRRPRRICGKLARVAPGREPQEGTDLDALRVPPTLIAVRSTNTFGARRKNGRLTFVGILILRIYITGRSHASEHRRLLRRHRQ